jgi:nucleotide-binding universal stress UspA family protein
MPFGRILVPLDGSEVAETALPYAALIPSRSVRLLAVEPVTLSAARQREARGEEAPWGPWLVTSTASYLRLLGTWCLDQEREIETVVTSGDPKRRIVEAAGDVDLIVMATRGQGLATTLLGRVADHVASHAPTPTLVVRHEQPAPPPAVLRVVVPLDGSDRAEEALAVAATLRDALGAGLHLVRVVDAAVSLATTDQLAREAAAYLEQQRTRGDFAGDASCEVGVISHGTVSERLLESLRSGDVVVMATQGRGGLRRLLGGGAAALLRQAPVPLVQVRAGVGEAEAALRGAAAGAGG